MLWDMRQQVTYKHVTTMTDLYAYSEIYENEYQYVILDNLPLATQVEAAVANV